MARQACVLFCMSGCVECSVQQQRLDAHRHTLPTRAEILVKTSCETISSYINAHPTQSGGDMEHSSALHSSAPMVMSGLLPSQGPPLPRMEAANVVSTGQHSHRVHAQRHGHELPRRTSSSFRKTASAPAMAPTAASAKLARSCRQGAGARGVSATGPQGENPTQLWAVPRPLHPRLHCNPLIAVCCHPQSSGHVPGRHEAHVMPLSSHPCSRVEEPAVPSHPPPNWQHPHETVTCPSLSSIKVDNDCIPCPWDGDSETSESSAVFAPQQSLVIQT